MRCWPVLAIALVAVACERGGQPPQAPARRAQQAAVPGVETAVAAAQMVHDVVRGFGAVAAQAEPADVRDARTQLAEAEARQRLAAQQVQRLEALAQGAVVPRKELEAARAEESSVAAVAAHARQVLASFGTTPDRAVLQPDETWVIAQVVQLDLAHVQAGSAARFRPDAFPTQTFSGAVDAAPAYVDPATRTAPVRVRVRDPEHVLRPGMTGALLIEFGAAREAVFVPSTAVVYDGAQPVVFVEDDQHHYVARPVKLGAVRDGQEIQSGVTAGQRVVVTGAASLLSASSLRGGDED